MHCKTIASLCWKHLKRCFKLCLTPFLINRSIFSDTFNLAYTIFWHFWDKKLFNYTSGFIITFRPWSWKAFLTLYMTTKSNRCLRLEQQKLFTPWWGILMRFYCDTFSVISFSAFFFGHDGIFHDPIPWHGPTHYAPFALASPAVIFVHFWRGF